MNEFLLDVLDWAVYLLVLLAGLTPLLIIGAAFVAFVVIAFRRPKGDS